MRRSTSWLFFAAALLPGIAAGAQPTTPGLEIFVFRVGQADSMLIVGPQPQRRSLLVDLGVSRHHPFTGTKTARHVAKRIVEITGRRHIDYFLLTHFHMDHFGNTWSGVTAFLEDGNANATDDFTIGTVIDTGALGAATVDRGSETGKFIARLDRWQSEGRIGARTLPHFGVGQIELGPGVSLDLVACAGGYDAGLPSVHQQYLQTHPGHYSTRPHSENDLSIAFELSLGAFEFWTGGDLSGDDGDGTEPLSGSNYTNVETPMVARWQQTAREADVEIYRANHHGASYSTTPQLLAALDPEHVLYSAHLGHKHPSLATVERVRATARQYATGIDRKAWGHGNRFYNRGGRILGEIRILVAPDGATYARNGARYRSYSDDEERSDLDAAGGRPVE